MSPRETTGFLRLPVRLEHAEVALGGPQFRLFLRPGPSAQQRHSVATATPFVLDPLGLNIPWDGERASVMRHAGDEVARNRFQVNVVETGNDVRVAAFEG